MSFETDSKMSPALAAVRLVSSRAASQMQLHHRHTSLNRVGLSSV